MFGKRSDGKLVKGLDGVTRLMPLCMKSREGAVNNFKLQLEAKYFDEFIAEQKQQGKEYTYRDIIMTTLVRCFKKYPRLNRFISAGRIYQRNHIDISMNVHKSLRVGEEEAVIKLRFTGYETIDEVKAILDSKIKQAIEGNDLDDTAELFSKLPHFLLRFIVGTIKLFDRWGLWSDKFLFDISPFHTSIYFSDLKSVHLDYVYHHLYNFGNCGFFAAMGKEKLMPVVNKEGEITPEKILEIGISEDERFVDGLYFSRVLKAFKRICQNLTILQSPLAEDEINRLKTYKEIKAENKQKKRQKKLDKKLKKQKK